MWIFTTREIAIFTYALILIVFLLVSNKGKSIVMPVIKTAFNIKLIVPFLLIISFSALFTWGCTFLPFWNWVYVKDIIFWTIFAGVPICFNATKRNLEKHYYKSIIFDNLKFTALVEFITGTFTFHIVLELILQPLLVTFVYLQSTKKCKSSKVKKIVDALVGITGFAIIILTIISIISSINNIKFIDIIVSLVLPIILSTLYLPMAYLFSIYAKYETIFVRIRGKEPNNRKQKINNRIRIILTCKLSYKKLHKLLYEYIPTMYINTNGENFDRILNDFLNDNV